MMCAADSVGGRGEHVRTEVGEYKQVGKWARKQRGREAWTPSSLQLCREV